MCHFASLIPCRPSTCNNLQNFGRQKRKRSGIIIARGSASMERGCYFAPFSLIIIIIFWSAQRKKKTLYCYLRQVATCRNSLLNSKDRDRASTIHMYNYKVESGNFIQSERRRWKTFSSLYLTGVKRAKEQERDKKGNNKCNKLMVMMKGEWNGQLCHYIAR